MDQAVTVAAEMLDLSGLSEMLGLSPNTILTLRTRSPDRVPTPWRTRPLRWRRATVHEWIREQELEERRKVAERCKPVSVRVRKALPGKSSSAA